MATKLKIYIILFILSFFSFSMAQNKINLKLYKEKKEKYFLKDEKISVYQKSFYTRANKFLFGCPIDGKRNDSIFLKGNILLRKNCIICKEEFFYDLKNQQDSIITKFIINKNNVIVEESLTYKNGKIMREYNRK